MSLIEWKKEFLIGVPDVDHEHRELIELINRLHASLDRDDPPITVEEFLGDIYAQISAHFALEEKIMRHHNYDEYKEHKADHERLLDDIRDIMDDYQDDSRFDKERLAERLKSWFTLHFKTKDARLHKSLR
ncbi:MAG: hemerythrin family protein [Gammaproteobacteria bacterium]|jgi:hemerythrin-like metal-binding protein|nr:hemerythrin family protein [Gammaproteobacteria bacterium]